MARQNNDRPKTSTERSIKHRQKLMPDSMKKVSFSRSVLNIKLKLPYTTWFEFRPDQPSDSENLKLLAEELVQFKDKSTNVASNVSVAREKKNKKTPKTSQSGNASALATPSQNKRKAENTVLSAGKKPCLSSDRRPIQDMRQASATAATTQSPAIDRIPTPPGGSSFQGDPLNISMHVTAPSTNKQEIIKRNLELLVLESQCKLENCHYHPGCRKFKWRIEHFNLCSGQKLENPDCKLCTVLLGYFHEHAKLCKNANCKVINCLQIKEKHRVP